MLPHRSIVHQSSESYGSFVAIWKTVLTEAIKLVP